MEIEAKLIYKDKEAVLKWLKDNGFTFTKNKEIQDSYFGLMGDSMDNIKSLYRIRNVVGEFRELTLKDSKQDNKGVWSRREINVSINDPEAMVDILRSLNCKLIKENYSKREIWNKGGVEFAFIDFSKPAELHIAEIEGPDEDELHECIKSLTGIAEVAGKDGFACDTPMDIVQNKFG